MDGWPSRLHDKPQFVSGRCVEPTLRATLALVVAVLTGCAESTDIPPVGLDLYTVSTHFAAGHGGSATAEETALTEANTFCAQQGRAFLPVEVLTPTSANLPGERSYSATFRCVPAGDPALPRASNRRPEAIIEGLRDYVLPDCDSELSCP